METTRSVLSKSNKNSENALIIIQSGKEFVQVETVSSLSLGTLRILLKIFSNF